MVWACFVLLGVLCSNHNFLFRKPLTILQLSWGCSGYNRLQFNLGWPFMTLVWSSFFGPKITPSKDGFSTLETVMFLQTTSFALVCVEAWTVAVVSTSSVVEICMSSGFKMTGLDTTVVPVDVSSTVRGASGVGDNPESPSLLLIASKR